MDNHKEGSPEPKAGSVVFTDSKTWKSESQICTKFKGQSKLRLNMIRNTRVFNASIVLKCNDEKQRKEILNLISSGDLILLMCQGEDTYYLFGIDDDVLPINGLDVLSGPLYLRSRIIGFEGYGPDLSKKAFDNAK